MQVDRIDPAFGYWFAGFVDGEGCFFIRRMRSRYKANTYVAYGCSLSIAVRADDLATLEEVRDVLGVGAISHRHQGPAQGTRGNPSACLSIHNKDAVLRLVDLFDRFPLRSKKARDYEVWRRAVLEWHREKGGKGHTRDWGAMEALHHELKDVRKYIPEQEVAHG